MNLQEILKQAERGVHQTPTLAGYRHPKIKGWKELTTTNPDRISQMAANGYAGCNWVSVAKNGFACIIDIDDVEYAKSIGMPIPWDTFIVNTPSGGLHVYLWHTNESVELGNTNIVGPDGSLAVEFKANNVTCASPGDPTATILPSGVPSPAARGRRPCPIPQHASRQLRSCLDRASSPDYLSERHTLILRLPDVIDTLKRDRQAAMLSTILPR